MIGLVFGLEKNVWGYILVYTNSQGFFFWWVCHWTAGGGGYGECTMDPGLVKNVYHPSKTLLIGQVIFWCIPKKARNSRLLSEG